MEWQKLQNFNIFNIFIKNFEKYSENISSKHSQSVIPDHEKLFEIDFFKFIDFGSKTLSFQISPSSRIMSQESFTKFIFEEFMKQNFSGFEKKNRESGIKISHQHTGMWIICEKILNFFFKFYKDSWVEWSKISEND